MMKNEVNAQYRYTNVTAPIQALLLPNLRNKVIWQVQECQFDYRIAFCFTGASFGFGTDITLIKQGMSVKVVLKNTNQEVNGR
jgi:hypothetical protein